MESIAGAALLFIGLFFLSLDLRRSQKRIAEALERIADRLGEQRLPTT